MSHKVSVHINDCHIGGRLAQKPIYRRTFTRDIPILQFVIAHNSSREDEKDSKKVTYIGVEVWGSRADELRNILDVGDMVEVVGPLHVDTYEKDGIQRKYPKIKMRLIAYDKKAQQVGGEQDLPPQSDMTGDEQGFDESEDSPFS